MRQVFMMSLAMLIVGLFLLAIMGQWSVGLIIGLMIYYIGFNSLEATIPSWISKKAPVANKATAMGINSSAQFFGAFVGGALGGVLLTQSIGISWAILGGLMGMALLLIVPIKQPPYLTSLTVTLPTDVDYQQWSKQLLEITAIDEVVMMEKEKIAYLKLDKQLLNDNSRQQLSHLTNQTISI